MCTVHTVQVCALIYTQMLCLLCTLRYSANCGIILSYICAISFIRITLYAERRHLLLCVDTPFWVLTPHITLSICRASTPFTVRRHAILGIDTAYNSISLYAERRHLLLCVDTQFCVSTQHITLCAERRHLLLCVDTPFWVSTPHITLFAERRHLLLCVNTQFCVSTQHSTLSTEP